MKGRRRSAAALLTGVLLNGCFAAHSLTPLALDIGPAVQTYKPAPLQTMNFSTFSVFPISAVNGEAQMKGADYTRPVLFAVRSMLEARGYRFVPAAASPDFLVGVDGAAPIRGTGKRIVEIAPGWKDDPRVPSPIPAAALSTQESLGWGTVGDPAALVAPLPQYPPPGGDPGSGGARYLHQATISIVDGHTLTEIWASSGAGVSRTPDIRIGLEPILWCMLHQFPAAVRPELDQNLADVPGMKYEILTNDGVGFYPAVLSVENNSPGWQAGVLPYDMILAVGGEPTWNKPFSAFRPMLTGPKESTCNLTLWRNGQQVNALVRRIPPVSGGPDDGKVLTAAPMLGAKPKLETLDIAKGDSHGSVIWPVLGAVVIATTIIVAASSGGK